MLRFKPLLFYILLFLTNQQGAAQPGTALTPTTPSLRLVVIGSSTAAGTGAAPIDSAWVNRYRQYLQLTNPANAVLNLARGGYQTYHLMPSNFRPPDGRPAPDTLRNITQALALHPDAIILNLPSNDAAAGYPAAEQLANFDAIVQTALTAGVPIWVCSTQPRNFDTGKVAVQQIVRDSIFQRYGYFSIDFWNGSAKPEGRLDPAFDAGDGIHLNNAGHRLLFERVVDKQIPVTLVLFRRLFEWIRGRY